MSAERNHVQRINAAHAKPMRTNLSADEIKARVAELRAAGLDTAANRLEKTHAVRHDT
ncbi:hypothetical protein [Falsiruegeria mediterranea]